MSRTCIHIGLPKAGSKTLQRNFFPSHPDIEYLGGKFSGPKIVRHRWWYQWLIRKFRERGSGQYKNAALREVFHRAVFSTQIFELEQMQKLLSQERNLDRLGVMSLETLALPSLRHRVPQMREVFGPAKIILVIRRPLELVESSYFQWLQRMNKTRPGCWPFYRSIEYFLERGFHGPPSIPATHLDLAPSLSLFETYFGRDNIGLFTLEQMATDRDGFYAQLCDFLEIQPFIPERNPRNRRFSQAQVEALKFKRSHLVPGIRYALTVRPSHRLKALGPFKGEPARAEIPPKWRGFILQTTAPIYRDIQRRYGLDLESLGYPV